MQHGVGRHYREFTWIERFGTASGAFMPAWLRRVMKKVLTRVLAKMPADRFECRLPGGESFRVDPEFRHLAWNPEEYAALKAAVSPGNVVFDIGANVGAYSMLCATWAGEHGRVYAFEPAPAARAGLMRHLALNGLADRVVVQPQAVSDRISKAPFLITASGGDSRLLQHGVSGAVMVRTLAIDDFCAARGVTPDVIKMDIEGAELAALRGARHTIARCGSRLALFVELHPSLWAAQGYSRRDLEQELETQGLRAEALPGIADPWDIAGVCVRLRSINADPDR